MGAAQHTSKWLVGAARLTPSPGRGFGAGWAGGGTFPAREVPTPAGHAGCRGARHGLTMSAKLARLEEQERAFLATYRHQQREPPESSPGAERQEKRKQKRKKCRDGADPKELQSQEPSGEEEGVAEEGKVMKRKKKNHKASGEEEVAGEERKAAKRKKKKKQQEEDREDLAETEVPPADADGPDQAGHSPRKKRKKRRKEPQ